MEHNYYLAHHGVKGQKWGIRKKRELSGARPARSKKSRYSKYSKYVGPKALKKNIRKSIALAIGFDAAAVTARIGARKMMSQGDALRARRLIGLSIAAQGAAVGAGASAIGSAIALKKTNKNRKGK